MPAFAAMRARASSATALEAQLVSVAGVYVVNEEIEARYLGKRVQIRCENDAIVMERLPWRNPGRAVRLAGGMNWLRSSW